MKKIMNKAVYTATPVAGGWAGAVISWAGAVMSWAGAVMTVRILKTKSDGPTHNEPSFVESDA